MVVGGIETDVELPEFNRGELELIFEAQYAGLDNNALKREAAELEKSVKSERLKRERKELEAQISEAEKAGNEELEQELMKKLNQILRKR